MFQSQAEAFRQFSPLHPGAESMNDAVDHLPMIPPPAAPVVGYRQQRLQHSPLAVRPPLLSMPMTATYLIEETRPRSLSHTSALCWRV